MCSFFALKANARKAVRLFIRSPAFLLKKISQYTQITRSRITTCFFLLSFVYCLVQSILQSLIFSVDIEYRTLVTGIVQAGNIPASNFTFLQDPGGHLQLQICNDIPHGQIPYPCTTIYTSGRPLVRPIL